MKKVLVIVISLFVLLFAGLWAYVANLDWNKHKDKIAAQIFELTGKKIVFDGSVALTLLPSPYLTANDVKVFNSKGVYSDKPLAEFKSLVAKVSLSSLWSEDWDISRLSILEPEIFIDVAEDGQLNWISDTAQSSNFQDNTISLDSATLEKAKLHLTDNKNGIDTVLTNLNAEIIAENIMGPYRIEGSYTRDDKPEGFAVSLGQFTKSFATTVNLVINYPSTESYVRFDGSLLLADRTLKGNVIFESNKLADFLNMMLSRSNIDASYNLPFAISAAVAADKTRLDFSNVVVKYGKTSGAGNILVPLSEDVKNRKIELAFNMTDWDLEPLHHLLLLIGKGYQSQGVDYSKDWNVDFICDIKALKAYYNDETIRNLTLSFDWINKSLKLRELSGELFADTELNLKGDFDVSGQSPSYNLDADMQTSSFDKLMQWWGMSLKQQAPATYQKAKLTAKLKGNFENLQISPLEFSLDNTVLNGEAGFIFGENLKSMFVLNADTINFDNYIPKLSEADDDKNFVQKILSQLQTVKTLENLDTRVILNVGLAIYNAIPYEKVASEFSLINGVWNIQKLNIANVLGSRIQLSGELKDLLINPNFQNLNFNIESEQGADLLKALGFDIKDDLLKSFSAKGSLTGDVSQTDVQLTAKLENLNLNYLGKIDYGSELWNFNGNLELKNPDFVKFVNNSGFNYKPRAFSLGLLQFTSQISGNKEKFTCDNVDMNIGSNNFQGTFLYDKTTGRPFLNANLKINRFELERFLQDSGNVKNRSKFQGNGTSEVAFLQTPELSNFKFDYKPLNEFDLNGTFFFDNLSYKDEKLSQLNFILDIKEGAARFSEIKTMVGSGNVSGNLELLFGTEPKLNGNFVCSGQNITGKTFSGSQYGLSSGIFSGNFDFTTSAVSFDDMFSHLNGSLKFTIDKPVWKGWNLTAIAEDLKKRTDSEGVPALIQDNMQKGSTPFERLVGTLNFVSGRFSFENSEFVSQLAKIPFQASGNLSSWNVDARFDVNWNNWENMVGFIFAMNGELDFPQVSVDASKLVKMFDDKNAQIAAEQKAKALAREQKLKSQMEEQQQRAKKLKDEFENKILVQINQYNDLLESEGSKLRLDDLLTFVNQNIEQLGNVFTLAMTPEYDEQLVAKVKSINDEVEFQKESYPERIEAIYHDDVAEQMELYYNKLLDINRQTEALNKQNSDNYTFHSQRLIKANSPLVLTSEIDVAEIKNNIGNNFVILKGAVFDSTKDFGVIKNENITENMVEFTNKLKENFTKAETELKKLQDNVDKMYNLCEAKVLVEEEKEKQRLENEAIKKKLEENTSTISVVGSGKVMKVVPDIEDVNRAEEAIRDEKVKVLDFTKDKSSSGVVRQDNAHRISQETNYEKSGLVVKNGDDDILEATGKVVRQ